MPIATIAEARDEILAHFTTAWNTLPTPPPVIYPDKPRDLPDDGSYVKVFIQHVDSPQRTLGGKPSQGGSGRRFARIGIFTVQVFTIAGDGLTTSDPLVDLIVDAFEGESTGSDKVEFRNIRVNEIGNDGIWHQTNVTMDFEYHRVK